MLVIRVQVKKSDQSLPRTPQILQSSAIRLRDFAWSFMRRITMWKKAVVAIIVLATCQPCWAFYCGQRLVKEGDYKLQVLEKCGQPDYSESRVEYRSTVMRGSGIQQPGLDFINQVPVQIEEWTYDFGRHRFMQFLHFENGRLIWVNNLGYGTAYGSE